MLAYTKEVLHRIAIMQAYLDGKPIEVKGLDHDPDKWFPVTGCRFDNWEEYDYRMKPKEAPKPDTIDWSAVHPRFNFMARDEDDQVWLFEKEPAISEYEDGVWAVEQGGDSCRGDTLFASYKNGGLSWYESLVERP